MFSSSCSSDPAYGEKGTLSFLCVHPTGRVCTLKQREEVSVLRCLLLPAWGSDYKAEDKPWRQAHLGLPLATSLALGKLLNPCKILATLCSLEVITAPTSQGCFEDKMRYCIKRESLQRLAHSIYLSTHSV